MILTAKCLDMQLFFSGSGSCHFYLKNELFSGKYYFSWFFCTNFASCVSPLILWTCASAPAGNSRKIIIHHHAASTGERKQVIDCLTLKDIRSKKGTSFTQRPKNQLSKKSGIFYKASPPL